MLSKFRLSKYGIAASAVALCALAAGSFSPSDYLPAIVLVAVAAILCLSFPIFVKLKACILEKNSSPNQAQAKRKWNMMFLSSVAVGFSYLCFLSALLLPEYGEFLRLFLLFVIIASAYLYLASQSAALKGIGMENWYWIGGIALHSSVFFMLYTMEREFYGAVLLLFVASVAVLLFSFIYPHLMRTINKKDNLPYLFSTSGFTFLLSYTAVATLLRNYQTIAAGYQFMDFAFITIFYAMMVIGLDLKAADRT